MRQQKRSVGCGVSRHPALTNLPSTHLAPNPIMSSNPPINHRSHSLNIPMRQQKRSVGCGVNRQPANGCSARTNPLPFGAPLCSTELVHSQMLPEIKMIHEYIRVYGGYDGKIIMMNTHKKSKCKDMGRRKDIESSRSNSVDAFKRQTKYRDTNSWQASTHRADL